MKSNEYIVPYRKHYFSLVVLFVLFVCSGIGLKEAIHEQNTEMIIFLIISIIILGFFLFSLTYGMTKPYQLLLDSDRKMVFVNGLRHKKTELDLTKMMSVSFKVASNRYSTSYVLQFKTTPEIYGEYYRKNDQQVKTFIENYEYMYITIQVADPKTQVVEKFIEKVSECGLKITTYEEDKYGFIKEEKSIPLNPIYRKAKRRQWYSYFFIRFIIFTFIFSVILSLLGRFVGIYW